ncbi:flagellar biosynthetic protein FlhB [Desulfuromonas versatilis]|uniref:Flagellar biosynthetic protein FlhB n=1 Tax=Desulfuromonas versatilis TaxID=2802975 RepID=A0ABN6E5F8_9BACT|nr:EscU/YscU/HrcU family type III secretion system export apparatus switch protein [Desulfuromonas versatilis]BCR06589.1 flagellar biosynthetic protein FlhB [Desulfuromonas versatilis]
MAQDKPIEKAVALLYDRSRGDAPQVVAGGKGSVAQKIIETARKAGVEVVEDGDLLELLARVPVGQEIPLELYQAVAEILAFVYRVNNRYRERGEGQ